MLQNVAQAGHMRPSSQVHTAAKAPSTMLEHPTSETAFTLRGDSAQELTELNAPSLHDASESLTREALLPHFDPRSHADRAAVRTFVRTVFSRVSKREIQSERTELDGYKAAAAHRFYAVQAHAIKLHMMLESLHDQITHDHPTPDRLEQLMSKQTNVNAALTENAWNTVHAELKLSFALKADIALRAREEALTANLGSSS